jgi:hypothetical protein
MRNTSVRRKVRLGGAVDGINLVRASLLRLDRRTRMSKREAKEQRSNEPVNGIE